MATVEIRLRIPSGRESSAEWLQRQDPGTTADALQWATRAFALVRAEACGDEAARLVEKNSAELSLVKSAYATESALQKEESDRQVKEIREEARYRFETARTEHLEEIKTIRADLAKQAEIKDDVLRQNLEALRTELHKRRGEEALIRSEVTASYESQRKLDQNSHEEEMSRVKDNHAIQIASSEERVKEAKEREKESVEYFKSQLESRTAKFENTERENKERLAECTSKMESTLSSFRSSVGVGKVGESLVSRVFADLNLGGWEDVSKSDGRADFLWTYSFPSCSKLCALVEVKTVAAQKNLEISKFERDVNSELRNSRINGAIFISLTARVPGTRQLDLRLEQGTPILWASRSADDELPAKSLIEFAFLAFAQNWPVLCHQRGEDVESTVEAVAALLDSQLAEFESFRKRIESIENLALQLQRQAVSLRKIKENLSLGVDNIRLKFPGLTLAGLEDGEPASNVPAAETTWDSAAGVEVLEAIRAWRRDKGGGRRYPKLVGELAGLSEDAVSFVGRWPGSFTVGVSMVKDEVQREIQSIKRRRVTEEGLQPAEGFGEPSPSCPLPPPAEPDSLPQ